MALLLNSSRFTTLAFTLAIAGCSSSSTTNNVVDPDAGTNTGGNAGSVGGASAGGKSNTSTTSTGSSLGGGGGLSSAGGTAAIGGTTGVAGSETTGGNSGIAGSPASGGITSVGGTPSTLSGGSPGTSTGGTTSTGGSSNTPGGTSATGGTSTILVTGGAPTVGGAAAGGISSTGGAPGTTGGAATGGASATGGAATGGAAPSALSATPTGLAFGAILVSGQSQVGSVTISNKGGTASSAISTSLPAGPFTLASDTCKNVSLAPNATCTIGVTFNPVTVNATQTGSLSVSATTGGDLAIGLSGSAVALSLDQSSFSFPTTNVLSISAARSFTVTNPSIITAGSTTGLAVAFTGTAKDEYHVDSSTCTGSLGASGTCTVIVSFRPLTFGARSATMTVSATPGGSVSATLSGQGQAADGQQGCTGNTDCQSGVCLTYYQDADSDTYGDPGKPLSVCGNGVPTGYVANAFDCTDNNPNLNQNTTSCGTSTQRKYCLTDAVVRYQDCTGGCVDGVCVGTVSIAGTFTCDNSLQCTTAQGCSWTGTPASPGTEPACNLDNSTANMVTCDDNSDCGTGQVCCRNSNCGLTTKTTCYSGTTCPAGGICSSYYQVCNPLSPSCPTGTTCKRSTYNISTGQGFWDCE